MWLSSLPIAALRNGDYLAVRRTEPDPAVVYLSHDDASLLIAPSFTHFLSVWSRLCYVGPEEWILNKFTDPTSGYLVADTPHAEALRELFRIP